MAGPDVLRPGAAAKRFCVSERTLSRWAAAGLIGTVTYYVASDVAELIASNMTRRTVMPITTMPAADDSWRDSPLWAGTTAGRKQATQ